MLDFSQGEVNKSTECRIDVVKKKGVLSFGKEVMWVYA